MRVLVTRPLEDAGETAALLKARGHEAVVAPLLKIDFHDGPQIDLSGIQAILATSANGVRALSRRTIRRDLPLFAVGPQTAHAAREAGFILVRDADGDAADLVKAVPAWASRQGGTLLHASGAEGGGKLAKSLTAAGFDVRSDFLYEVRAVTELPTLARDALASDSLDAALLFSPRSARTFANCVIHAGLTEAASRLVGVCISEATATGLKPLTLREVRVARRPNQVSLLDCLG
jgi:uroporphyrinogen-III synthase